MTPVKHAAEAGKARRGWSRKKIVGFSAAGLILLGGGTAWAAYSIFGYGHLDSAAAVTQNLTVNNESAVLTKKLVPGQTVGAKAVVTNPNDFSVTVTNVIVRNSSVAVNPNNAACQQSVHLIGTPTTWPDGGDAATLQQITENVVINPGESKWVEVTQAVKQDADATVLCGVSADFAVKAQTAS